jgi:hypothetical protein
MSKLPIVLYRGPSLLDGSPIVAIATIGSTNVKTGPMVQTWILRADMNPLEASSQWGSGAAPTLAVTLNPEHGWSIHT